MMHSLKGALSPSAEFFHQCFAGMLPFRPAKKKTPTFCNRPRLQRHEFQRGVDTDPVSAAANMEEFLAMKIGHQKRGRKYFHGKVTQFRRFDFSDFGWLRFCVFSVGAQAGWEIA